MKVVALVSGGKDSCYAMMRCIHFGHEIVALANLLPEDDLVDELDSYMYQTVGHQIIESYARCMGLPLFRKRIRGNSKKLQMRYTETEGDEVEDLEMLLREVQQQIPAVAGVSSGAIASNYQRLRVENVCSRLGLVSLAYLWMLDQDELLQQMLENGISAVLVKVAAIGLHPHKHLGRDLATMYPVFQQLHEKYGCNICGEGGEYESVTLDCPLFKNARIVLDDYDIVVSSSDSVAEVGFLRPKNFHLEPKASPDGSEESGVVHWVEDSIPPKQTKQSPPLEPGAPAELHLQATQQHVTFRCSLRNRANEPSSFPGPARELYSILSLVQEHLVKQGLGWDDVLYIHLYISDMKSFSEVNKLYSQVITEADCPNGVPSRSTVEIPGEAMVEVLASRKSSKRVLHVQSISCWAPSCIGPYSQATLYEQLVFMAGQIGLDPPTMALVSGGAAAEMRRCLMNAEAVAGSYGVALSSSITSLIVYCNMSTSKDERRAMSQQLLSFDSVPVLFVLVSDLPKGASVEIEPLLFCSSNADMKPEASCRNSFTIQTGILADFYFIPGSLCRCFIHVRSSTGAEEILRGLESVLHEAQLKWSDVIALRVYHSKHEVETLREALSEQFSALVMVPVHGIGCSSELDYNLALDLLATRSTPSV